MSWFGGPTTGHYWDVTVIISIIRRMNSKLFLFYFYTDSLKPVGGGGWWWWFRLAQLRFLPTYRMYLAFQLRWQRVLGYDGSQHHRKTLNKFPKYTGHHLNSILTCTVYKLCSLQNPKNSNEKLTSYRYRLFHTSCYAQSFGCVRLFATPWTIACQAPLSTGNLQAKILEQAYMPSSRGSSQPRDRNQASHIAGGFFTIRTTKEAQECWGR